MKNEKCLNMVCGAYYLPKDNDSKPQGEDAHFISASKQTIGVADGVGSWAKHGIDAGDLARELMMNSLLAVSFYEPKEVITGVDPKRVLRDAFAITVSKGSSTACIVSHRDGVLRAANVGDSGFMVFRKNKVVYRSPVQQRDFNFPYQLGNYEASDKPECALELEFQVVEGDVVVLGTDGWLDNMFESEAEAILEIKGEHGPEELAYFFGEVAYINSMDKFSESPFSLEAKRAGRNYGGGKIDDITVVVGKIVSS